MLFLFFDESYEVLLTDVSLFGLGFKAVGAYLFFLLFVWRSGGLALGPALALPSSPSGSRSVIALVTRLRLSARVRTKTWVRKGVRASYRSRLPNLSPKYPMRNRLTYSRVFSLLFYNLDFRQPFPANLMVGCFAIADAGQTIRTDLDNELEGAFPPLFSFSPSFINERSRCERGDIFGSLTDSLFAVCV